MTAASTRPSACLSTLIAATIATQQPVARDLRFLLSLDHVTYELERMGDHAASVAKQARKLAPFPPLGAYVDLPEMAALAAVARARDPRRARRRRPGGGAGGRGARRRDRPALSPDVRRGRSDSCGRIRPTSSAGTRILFAAHYLERIGDRVTNIAEDIVFLATGEIEDLNP